MLPPVQILVQIGYAAAVSAAVLLFTWPWRERGWPVPVALGLGVATCHVAWFGFPALWPIDRSERIVHFALLGMVLGAIEASSRRVPAPVRWISRALVAAGCAGMLMLPRDPAWKVALVGVGFLAAWSALEWRAARVEGLGTPAALVVVATAGAQAVAWGLAPNLAQSAGALAAAAGPLALYALLRPRLSLARGGVTAFTLAALPLWLCGWRLGKLPLASAALLAVAPIAAQRRWWLGALVAAAAAAFAAYLSHAANPAEPYG